jgi:hypothetical protein
VIKRWATARSILPITPESDQPDRRIVTQVKSAHGAPAGPRLVWKDVSPEDWRLGTGELSLSAEGGSVLTEACVSLADFLIEGPRPAREVMAEARGDGLSAITLYRAKKLLKVKSKKVDTARTRVPESVQGD